MTAIAPTKPQKARSFVSLRLRDRSVACSGCLNTRRPGWVLGGPSASGSPSAPREPAGPRIAQLAPGLAVRRPRGRPPGRRESWGAGPVVYLVHGWAGHRGQLAAFVPPLVAYGYRVVAFDAPSHGALRPRCLRAAILVDTRVRGGADGRRRGPGAGARPHRPLLGGTAAAAAVRDGLPADRVVLLAPLASPLSFARQFAAALRFR